jgi:hypothetical protein
LREEREAVRGEIRLSTARSEETSWRSRFAVKSCSKSSASLCSVTFADHFFPVDFFFNAVIEPNPVFHPGIAGTIRVPAGFAFPPLLFSNFGSFNP